MLPSPQVFVALLSPHYATLSYALPSWLCPTGLAVGTRVVVPLGSGALRLGVVVQASGKKTTLPDGVTLRNVLWPLDKEPILNAQYLAMIEQLSLRQSATMGQILGNVLPSGLRTTQVRLRVFREGTTVTHSMRDIRTWTEESLAGLGAEWLAGNVDVLAAGDDAAVGEHCCLRVDPPWPVRPSAKRQLAILEYLYEHGAVSRRRLIDSLGAESTQALASLVKHGYVELQADSGEEASTVLCTDALELASTTAFSLTQAQQNAVDQCLSDLDAPSSATRLLFGVTGSGKTAVYLELARECLARGRSVLLLAPEVALAVKLRRDVACTLPDAPTVLFHGYQSSAQREKTFRQLATDTTPSIIIGTRSALFLPIYKLGAVVLDEEHDSSFKQDEGLTYQAKDVAWFRVGQEKGLLLLGSATPDIKTWYAAEQSGLATNRLPERVGGGVLPSVELIDIKSLRSTDGVLAPQSLTSLRETIQRGEQAVVLLNRRGYAPLMYCLDCGTVARCPHCDIGLTYHKGREKLTCHYCGFSLDYPSPCLQCKGLHFLPMGEGTERLEETMRTLLPLGGKVLRLDRDTTRRPGRMEEILESFAREEAQILVGTQMLSKGHHFPNVTLAIVADADMGLNLPDYRAAERTFQLLVQSAGRAGRGVLPGKVLIQTRDTHHYCWDFIKRGDYEGFYREEIAKRERRKYPPFVRLALVRISFPVDWSQGQQVLQQFTTTLRDAGKKANVVVLGPAPAPLPLLRGRKRFQCLLKAQDWVSIRTLFAASIQGTQVSHFRVSLDIDPVNML